MQYRSNEYRKYETNYADTLKMGCFVIKLTYSVVIEIKVTASSTQ